MKISSFINQFSEELKASGRFRMCVARRSVLHSLMGFCNGAVPELKTIYTKEFLHRYEEYLILLGRKRNTVSFYMTVLRSIYHVAVDMGKLPYIHNLFADVFTGNDVTEKRAVDPDVVARIHAADFSAVPRLERCRDLFMLSFHLQGMSFIDLAHLRKSDIQGNVITYRRRKTGGLVSVSMLAPAKEIIDRYSLEVSDSPYVLPLITHSGAEGYRQYQSALRQQNRLLKQLGDNLGLGGSLTSYVARHSWATIAYHNGVDVSVVSQAMGHHTEEITRIYLSSFAQERLAEANLTVLMAILRPIQEGRVVQVTRAVQAEAEAVLGGFSSESGLPVAFSQGVRVEQPDDKEKGLFVKKVRHHESDRH